MNELDELRLKIAKVRGFTFGDYYPVDVIREHPVLGKSKTIRRPDGYTFTGPREMGEAEIWEIALQNPYFPDWPRDIAAAYELVAEMPRMQLNWYAKTAKHSRGKGGPLWTCRINMMNIMDFLGATAPEAIARAYLAWKDAQP
jgi:hypothetical protein